MNTLPPTDTSNDTDAAERTLDFNIEKLERSSATLADKISEGTEGVRELGKAALFPVKLLASLRRTPLPLVGGLAGVVFFYFMGRNFRRVEA